MRERMANPFHAEECKAKIRLKRGHSSRVFHAGSVLPRNGNMGVSMVQNEIAV